MEQRSKIISIKNILEVIAVFSAAIWALFNFVLKDKGSFNANIQTVNTLISHEWSTKEKYCVSYRMEIENIGNYPFYIDSIQVFYWIVPNNKIDNSVYYNYNEIQKIFVPNGSFSITDTNVGILNAYNSKQKHFKTLTLAFDSIEGKSLIIRSKYCGHYFNYLLQRKPCFAMNNAWIYDCWKRQLDWIYEHPQCTLYNKYYDNSKLPRKSK